jgi:hypothetical protein
MIRCEDEKRNKVYIREGDKARERDQERRERTIEKAKVTFENSSIFCFISI